MKILIVLVLTLSFVFSQAYADDLKVRACSQKTKVCSSFEADKAFSSLQEARFKLFLESQNGQEPQLVKVDLWMASMGHGSSPLSVSKVAPGHYDVTEAFFIMVGDWQVRVKYKMGAVEETLILPTVVTQ